MKKLFFIALALIAFAACNKDDVGNIRPEEHQSVKGNAFITVAFNSNTNSTRAGDDHKTEDDNQHHNAGTEAENAVAEALVIIAKCTDGAAVNTGDSYADLTVPTTDGTTNGVAAIIEVDGFTKGENGSYKLNIPYRMDYLGSYKVLVVLNPVDGLKDAIAGKNHKEAYEIVCKYHGNARTGEYSDGNFMMANKEQVVVVATENNNVSTSPVMANVAVERVISKVTFRYADPVSTYPSTLATIPNVYPVKTVVAGTVTAETDNFWYITDKNVDQLNYVYNYAINLNKATTENGTYWVKIKDDYDETFLPGGQLDYQWVDAIFKAEVGENQYTGIYADPKEGNKTVTDYLLTEDYGTAHERVTPEFVQSLTFVGTSNDNSTEETYYVHLTDYALVNLSKTVYAVRHINNQNGTRQFGILGSGEYLEDPQTASKNAAENSYASYFNQDIKKVQDAVNGATYPNLPDMFNALPAEMEDGAVPGVDTPHGNSIGAHLQYVYENAVTAQKQVAGLVTGIVFAGKIYDNYGVEVPVMYKYNQHFYRTLRALLKANPSLKDNGLTENSTDEVADKILGLDVYKNGRCYYYSAEIKHFEDNDNTAAGVMEYAIMRNNIYSLKVASIDDLGDARLDLTPSQSIVDVRAYVGVEVSILPWIVRFNDIEL